MNNEDALPINDAENPSGVHTLSVKAQCDSNSVQTTPVALSVSTIAINELRSLNENCIAMGNKMDRIGDAVELLVNKMARLTDNVQSLVCFIQFGIVSLFYLIHTIKTNSMVCLGDICCVYILNKMLRLLITWP
jgi:hypothetical protein